MTTLRVPLSLDFQTRERKLWTFVTMRDDHMMGDHFFLVPVGGKAHQAGELRKMRQGATKMDEFA